MPQDHVPLKHMDIEETWQDQLLLVERPDSSRRTISVQGRQGDTDPRGEVGDPELVVGMQIEPHQHLRLVPRPEDRQQCWRRASYRWKISSI